MSTWPEAVWIVRKMKKLFNIDTRLTTCAGEVEDIQNTISSTEEKVNTLDQQLQEFEQLFQLEDTLQNFRSRIQENSNKLDKIQNILDNLSQTPAIFDKDIQPTDNIPDTHTEEDYKSNSVWFVEQ